MRHNHAEDCDSRNNTQQTKGTCTYLLLSDTHSSICLARLRTSRLLSAAARCQAVLACCEWPLLLLLLSMKLLLLLLLSIKLLLLLLGMSGRPTAGVMFIPAAAPCCAVVSGCCVLPNRILSL
jgi:hypothetical protein